MNKKIGAILLIAGTCIGSGMIALPIVMAKLGIIFTIFIMLFIWFVMYFTSLVNIELNLQAKKGLSLGALGELFDGRFSKFLGNLSLKLLSYSLLSVFLYGTASVINHMFSDNLNVFFTQTVCATSSIIILLLPINLIDYFNRVLFILMFLVFFILLIGIGVNINWCNLPLYPELSINLKSCTSVIPVVFTSFGFQVIFHTLTNYCDRDKKLLKQAFFLGSFIPAIIYIVWTCGILSSIYNNDLDFYKQMISNPIEVGALVKKLKEIAKWQLVQNLIFCLSLLAIITSIIGVGRGLFDSLTQSIIIKNEKLSKISIAFLTIFPSYLITTIVPNAFIVVLGFAGLILSILAILLPIYILFRAKFKSFYYQELNIKFLIYGAVIVGLIVIISEIINLIR